MKGKLIFCCLYTFICYCASYYPEKIQYQIFGMIERKNQRDGDNFLDMIRNKQSDRQVDHQMLLNLRFKQTQQDQKQVVQNKTAIKINKFRQDLRRQQRQFHHVSHQFIKYSNQVYHSALDDSKFKIGESDDQRKGKFRDIFNNKNQATIEDIPLVNVSTNTQFAQAHLQEKFQIKETYLRVPFRHQSIEFTPQRLVHPNNDFFIFEHQKESIQGIRKNLEESLEQSLATQFKDNVKRFTYYLSFFDYIYLINRPNVQLPNEQPYPEPLQEIANNLLNGNADIISDSEESFDQRPLNIQKLENNHRMIVCRDDDLGKVPQSLYFRNVTEYTQYKNEKYIQFKNLKIYDKDISINTDARKIISSEKIYLIQIMKQLNLLQKIAKQAKEYNVIKEVYKDISKKLIQYLSLICGYTTSTIRNIYNIENQNEKIFEFIYNSLKFNKKVHLNYEQDYEIFQKFPLLQIWYRIPEQLFGYSKYQLHQNYYNLIRLSQKLESQIRYYEKYEELKKQRKKFIYS